MGPAFQREDRSSQDSRTKAGRRAAGAFATSVVICLTTSRGAVCTNLVGVYRALGGGWQLREGKPLLPEATLREMGNRTNWGGLLDVADEPPDRNASPEANVRLPDL